MQPSDLALGIGLADSIAGASGRSGAGVAGLVLLCAYGLDLLAGGQRFLGRFQGPDDYLFRLLAWLTARLDKDTLSMRVRWWRGVVTTALVLLMAVVAGAVLDTLMVGSTAFTVTGVILLSTLIGQRANWQVVGHLADAMQRRSAPLVGEEAFALARWSVEKLTLRFTDSLIANSLAFLAGGFTFLLAWRVVTLQTAVLAPRGLRRPRPGFAGLSAAIVSVIGLVFGIIAAVIIAAAHFLVPGTKPVSAFRFWRRYPGALAIRSMPMTAIARGLGLSFQIDPSGPASIDNWAGPKEGRARLEAADIRRARIILLLAVALWTALLIPLSAVLLLL